MGLVYEWDVQDSWPIHFTKAQRVWDGFSYPDLISIISGLANGTSCHLETSAVVSVRPDSRFSP